MKKIFLLLGLSVVLTSCTRSPQYMKDQKYYQTEQSYVDEKAQESYDKADKVGTPKKRLYVLTFFNATPFNHPSPTGDGPNDIGEYAAQVLIRNIRNSGRAVIPDNILSASSSKEFFVGDKVRVGSLLREARKLSVPMIVIGRINRIKYRQSGDPVGVLRKRKSMAVVDMEMRVFDVIEGKEMLTEKKVFESTTSTMNLFGREEADDTVDLRRELVNEALANGGVDFSRSISKVLEKVAWEGRIARISTPFIYINSGKASGLHLGDILKVLTPGEDIFDPATGAYMGRGKGQVKGTLEVVDYMGDDGAVTKLHSGGGFSENDIVQLY